MSTTDNSLRGFEADLKKFAETVDTDVKKVVKRVAFTVFRKLVKMTPVDTGRARAGWFMQVDKPGDDIPPEGKKSYPPPKMTIRGKLGDYPVIVIYNNVPYIQALNDGHSKRAPANFVELALHETDQEIAAELK